MALSDRRILEEMENGNIIIHPFERKNLGTSSYDLRIGGTIYRERKPPNFFGIFDPYRKEDVAAVWGDPEEARKAFDVLPEGRLGLGGIDPDDYVIMIGPGETVLAHTEEFIGGRNHITTMMKARSSLGRLFIEVCKCAGWGDVGYINRWTMEVTNNSQHHVIPLIVGTRVAQMVFLETGQIIGPDYSVSGAYQNSNNLETLTDRWTPEMMLPKLRK